MTAPPARRHLRIDYQLDPDDPATDAEAETTEERIRYGINHHLAWLGDTSRARWSATGSMTRRGPSPSMDFVRGRVVFTCNAAHPVPVFGVRGLNSGMEDPARPTPATCPLAATGLRSPAIEALPCPARRLAAEDQVRRETDWLTPPRVLDHAEPDDREQLLAHRVLLFADRTTAETFAGALTTAAALN